MKKQFLLLFLFAILCNLSAKNRIIENPAYEFKTSGIYNVTKIELGENETRVTVLCTFIPSWWVEFTDSMFIQDAQTGKKWIVKGIEGTEFEKQTYMPASGDSSFVLIFPKLNKAVKKANFGFEENKIDIFGVSLDPKIIKPELKKGIPVEVTQWLNDAVAKPKKQTSVALNPTAFFCKDTARLVGYIKGYDVRSKMTTGMLYEGNDVTREDYPIVAQIYPDGRFEAFIPMNHPEKTYIVFQNSLIQFYIEPGQTLGMILDWNDFLISDRLRNIRYSFKDITFKGPLAQINNDLMGVTLKDPDYRALAKDILLNTPADFKSKQLSDLKLNMDIIDQAIQKKQFTPEAIAILKAEALLLTSTLLFDFIYNRSYAARQDTINEMLKVPVSDDYYDFLQLLPLNDPTLLINNRFGTFVNRFEYCKPFSAISTSWIVQKSENKIKAPNPSDHYLNTWKVKDSIYQKELQLKPSLVYDIIKIRSLASTFKSLEKNDARSYLTSIQKNISNPFLIQEGERIFNLAFPDEEKTTYQLPAGKATDIFKKIIDQYKGKVLFIDFWATTCGPCVAGIKRMKPNREKYKDNKDFDFVFITSESASPIDAYDKFVKEQELVNIYRLSDDDHNYLRQLFRFNGIPHYVVIDREGKVLDDSFEMYSFDNKLENILSRK